MRDNTDLTPTPEQTAGPYFHLGCTATHSVSCIAGEDGKGHRVRLICRVLDGDGLPVNDAMIEIWQADSQGRYNHRAEPGGENGDPGCSGFGRLATNADGACVFETIKPGPVPGNGGTMQAPHFNVSVFARGILKRLVTRIYFADEPTNREDPILALVPEERRPTLMAHRDRRNPTDWHFDVRLCGRDETVFFDV